MTEPLCTGDETLHRVAGSIDVAHHMVERAAAVCRADRSIGVEAVLALFDAADALRVVADVLATELRSLDVVGPVA